MHAQTSVDIVHMSAHPPTQPTSTYGPTEALTRGSSAALKASGEEREGAESSNLVSLLCIAQLLPNSCSVTVTGRRKLWKPSTSAGTCVGSGRVRGSEGRYGLREDWKGGCDRGMIEGPVIPTCLCFVRVPTCSFTKTPCVDVHAGWRSGYAPPRLPWSHCSSSPPAPAPLPLLPRCLHPHPQPATHRLQCAANAKPRAAKGAVAAELFPLLRAMAQDLQGTSRACAPGSGSVRARPCRSR